MIIIPANLNRTPSDTIALTACRWRMLGKHALWAVEWMVADDYAVPIPVYDTWVAIYRGFKTDQASVVKNLSDNVPSIVHDFLYQHQLTEHGAKVTRFAADRAYLALNQSSWCILNRAVAWIRYAGVRLFGHHFAWRKRDGGDPIPAHAAHLYRTTPWGIDMEHHDALV